MQYDFLTELMLQRHRTVYARLTALDLQELPIESIEGLVTAGSVNVDGASSVRRTCQLTLVTERVDISTYLWGVNTKFKLEVGLQNNIDNNQPDIIWFKQGVFIITSFNISIATNNRIINLQAQDKMCLLNGTIAGQLPFEVDFGVRDETDETNTTHKKKNTLIEIIREAVHHYGQELNQNIIINDIDTETSLELKEYQFNTPLYLIRESGTPDQYFQSTLDGTMKVWIGTEETTLSAIKYDHLIAEDWYEQANQYEPDKFTFSNASNAPTYCCAKIDYGEAIGYTPTELVYPDDLIATVGTPLTDILDRIKSVLGRYEYFYDVDGHFVFQKESNYLTTTWTPFLTTNDGVEYTGTDSSPIVFDFSGNLLVNSISNNPQLSNLKNDFTIWGSKLNSAGKEIPIHMRYAIDVKPIAYQSIGIDNSELWDYNKQYGFNLWGQDSMLYIVSEEQIPEEKEPVLFNGRTLKTTEQLIARTSTAEYIYDSEKKILLINYLAPMYDGNNNILLLDGANGYEMNKILQIEFKDVTEDKYKICDWRELIYQMALDYRRYNHLDDFELRIAQANPELYPTGKTGYEQYYIDMEAFWRQLYNIDAKNSSYQKVIGARKEDIENYFIRQITYSKILSPQNGIPLYKYDSVGENYIPIRNIEKLPSLEECYKAMIRYIKASDFDKTETYYTQTNDFFSETEGNLRFWNKQVFEAPHSLNFWFDFLDANGDLGKFSVKAIGQRPKVESKSDAKVIYYQNVPLVVFVEEMTDSSKYPGYTVIQMPNRFRNMFATSRRGLSTKDILDDYLYRYTHCSDSISLNTLPIYYLEPNQLIQIQDENSKLIGKYITKSFTVPLAYSGTMNINAIKAVDRIY